MRFACAAALTLVAALLPTAEEHARPLTWQDVAPLHVRLRQRGVTTDDFALRVAQLADENARRVRLGDLDHLVFYLLQSTRFTDAPAVEPALSARSLVERLPVHAREAFLRDPSTARNRVSGEVRARASALLRAFESPGDDPRLAYFAGLVGEAVQSPTDRERILLSEYLRVMRFIYEKEFGAGRDGAAAAARLYRTRGLSTDTAVEAGFLVAQGLGVLRGLDPSRRIRRVLIVGAGLDLAPRTALLESAPPQSYQPWAVLDALVSLGLARMDDIEVVAADINPRVVDHLNTVRATPPVLTLLTGIAEDGRVTFAREYLEYFAALGSSIGAEGSPARAHHAAPPTTAGHRHKRLHVSPAAGRAVRAARLDVVTQRLVRREQGAGRVTDEVFDLIVATNVFPYFDDEALMLAMANIAGMLGTDGVLLHNETRAGLDEIATAVGLPLSHSRHAVIATVADAPPLGDGIWLHARRRTGRH